MFRDKQAYATFRFDRRSTRSSFITTLISHQHHLTSTELDLLIRIISSFSSATRAEALCTKTQIDDSPMAETGYRMI